jgi:hypothetical protein
MKAKQYISLENYFSGYLLNKLNFCSTHSNSDFDYDSCPEDCVLYNSSFWNSASIDFAKKARGHVNLILNGSRSIGALSNVSTFVRYELPYLEHSRVEKLKVLLLHNPDQEKFETCKRPVTLEYLKNVLKEKNITYECEDDPDNILLLMCFKEEQSKECQDIKKSYSGLASKYLEISLQQKRKLN